MEDGRIEELNAQLYDLTFEIRNFCLYLSLDRYSNGRLKLDVKFAEDARNEVTGDFLGRSDDLYKTLTVNIPAIGCPPDGMLVKSFNHDDVLYHAVTDFFGDFFEDTEEQVQSEEQHDLIVNIWKLV